MKKNKKIPFDKREYKTPYGYTFNLASTIWHLNKDVKVSVRWSSKLHKEVQNSFLHVLAFYAENYSAGYAQKINAYFRRLVYRMEIKEISCEALISYRAMLSEENEDLIGSLRKFFNTWHEMGYHGVSKDVTKLLNGWTLKGTVRGRPIAILDPKTGPLSDIEMAALIDKLLLKYAKGKISLADYAL